MAAAFERAHDPAEAPKCHGPIAIGIGILRPFYRPKQLFQYQAHVRIGPGARVGYRHVDDVGRGKVVAAQPDFDLQAHALDSSPAIPSTPADFISGHTSPPYRAVSAASSACFELAGAWHTKLRQT